MSTAAVSTPSIYQELHTFYQQRRADLQQLGQSLQSGDVTGAKQEYAALQTLGQSGPFANGDTFRLSQRQQDFNAIGQALQSGNTAAAEQAYTQLENTFHHQRQSAPPPTGTEIVLNLGTPTPGEQITINLGNFNGAGQSASPDSNASTTSSAPAASAAAPAAAKATSTTASTPATSQASPAASATSAAASQPAAGTEIVINLGAPTPGEQITIGLKPTGNGNEQLTLDVANQQNQSPEKITVNLKQNSNELLILNLFNSTSPTTNQGSGVNLTA